MIEKSKDVPTSDAADVFRVGGPDDSRSHITDSRVGGPTDSATKPSEDQPRSASTTEKS